MKPTTVIIGIGNEYRGDDAVGLTTVRLLRAMNPSGVELIELGMDIAGLMDAWAGARVAIVIDAVCSGAEPGTIHRLDIGPERLPPGAFRSSTHDFGPAEAIQLAHVLESLPPRLIVYGIEGRNFTAGAVMSLEAERAAQAVAEEINTDEKTRKTQKH